MKKFFCFLFLMLGFILVGCDTTNTSEEGKLSYISMRINPEIELVVDEDEEVVETNAINEDGETVLSENTLVGLSVLEAAEEFTSLAVELGYIDVDTSDANVYILTDACDEEKSEILEKKITEKVNEFFNKKGIFGKVCKEDLEDLKALAEEWGVTVKDVKMINRILELYPELSLEEALELTFEQRVELIKDNKKRNGLIANVKEEYKEDISNIKEEYEELFNLRKEVKELFLQLDDESLTDEERNEIEALIEAKKEMIDNLTKEYKEKVEEVKEEKRQKVEEIKEDIKEEASKLREEVKDKVENHEKKVEENKEEYYNKVKDWRNKQKR